MLILQAAKETVEMSILTTLAASDAMLCLIRPAKAVTHGKYIVHSRSNRVVHRSYFC